MVRLLRRAAAICALIGLAFCSNNVRSAHAQGAAIDDLWALVDFAAHAAPIAISSDGARLAFVARTPDLPSNRYVYTLLVMQADEPGSQRPIADAGDIVLGSVRGRRSGVGIDRMALWAPDDAWIAYLVGVDAYAELWRVRPDGRRAQRVSAPGEHVISFSWAPDGALEYSIALSQDTISSQLAQARTYGFHADGAFEPIYDVAPRIDDASVVSAWRENVRTGRRTQIATLDDNVFPDNVRIVAADARFADAESPELALEAVSGGVTRRCLHAGCQGDLIRAWAGRGDTVLFQRQTGHHGALTELASWSRAADAVRSIHVSEARLSGCVYDRAWFYCLEDAPTQPQRLVRISAQTAEHQVLWDPNPQWRRLTMPRVERLDTTSPGGQASYAHLVYPLDYVAGRRYPLVIVQYRSRGFLRGGTGGEHPIFPLSARGYFVLSVDRPEDFERSRRMNSNALLVAAELDGSEFAMKASAIETFIDQLDSRGLVDAERIGITGMSDGTETLFYMLLNSRRRFAAAVTSSSPPDPSTWMLLSADFRARRTRHGVMSPWSDADPQWVAYWRRLSPIHHMERMRTPILFNLSETETLPVMPLVARLQERGAPHDLYVYPGAYHNKWRPAQNRAAQMRATAWLDLWLRDVDTPDAQEPHRAMRWRAMRDGLRPAPAP